MGEIHELFVLPLSLVWFAGATPEKGRQQNGLKKTTRSQLTTSSEYYEARNDYTNDSETILLCNRCV